MNLSEQGVKAIGSHAVVMVHLGEIWKLEGLQMPGPRKVITACGKVGWEIVKPAQASKTCRQGLGGVHSSVVQHCRPLCSGSIAPLSHRDSSRTGPETLRAKIVLR
jgi:hypothetical protein